MPRVSALLALTLTLALASCHACGADLSACPPDMVRVPAGSFIAGVAPDNPWDPTYKITLTRPYCIDRTEVTLADHRRCEADGACSKSAPYGGTQCNEGWDGRERHPVNCVSWFQADAYCRWAKKRLPTAAEWAFAARGPKSFRFPWGNDMPTSARARTSWGTHVRGTAEVGTHPAGVSPFGALDMGGNVAEWVADWVPPLDQPVRTDQVDPTGPAHEVRRGLRDFGWDGGLEPQLHNGRADRTLPDYVGHTVGFRCARDLRP